VLQCTSTASLRPTDPRRFRADRIDGNSQELVASHIPVPYVYKAVLMTTSAWIESSA